jgi:DNA-binding MarR family transcriptional regulator
MEKRDEQTAARLTGGVSPSDPPIDLLLQLLKLASLINGPMQDAVAEPNGIGLNELKAIIVLSGEGALAGHDLVEITGISPMNVSRALASLRDRGWIESADDPANRRRKPVRLSAAGLEAIQKLTPAVAAVAEALLGQLKPPQRAQLSRIGDSVIERMCDWIVGHHAEVQLRR